MRDPATPRKSAEPESAPPQPGATADDLRLRRSDVVMMYLAYSLRFVAPMVLVPFYGRILGIDGYGRLLAAMALFQVVWACVEWGLPTVGTRDIAATRTPDEQARVLGQQIAARLSLAVIAVPLAIGFGLWSPILRDEPLLVAIATCFGLVAAMNLTWYFQGVLQNKYPVFLEMAGLVCSTTAIFLLLDANSPSWLPLLILLTVGTATIIISGWRVLRSVPVTLGHLSGPWTLVKRSAYMFLHRGTLLLMGPATVFAVGLVSPAAAAGTFALAERLTNMVLALLQPLTQLFVGVLNRRALTVLDGSDVATAFEAMRRATCISVALAVGVAGVLAAAAGHLVPWILGSGYDAAVTPLRWMCLSVVFVVAARVITSYVIVPLKMDREAALLSLTGVVLSLVLACVGGWFAGAEAATIGRTIGAAIGALLTFAILQRHESLRGFFRVTS